MRRLMFCLVIVGIVLPLTACSGKNDPAPEASTTPGQVSVSTTSLTTAAPSEPPTAPAPTTVSSPTSTAVVAKAGAPDPRLHSPKNGSPEFKAISDALRSPVQEKLGQEVRFVVGGIEVQDGFAFMQGRPIQPSGAAIDYRLTPYREQFEAGAFDDAIFALLRWTDDSWKVLTYNIGATDVTWLPWADEFGAPKAIFPNLGE